MQKELSIFIDESGDFGSSHRARDYSIDERRKLIYNMLHFVLKCPIQHHTISVKRGAAPDKVTLSRDARDAAGIFDFCEE